MKKIIAIVTVLFLVLIGIMLFSFNKIKINKTYDLIEYDNLIVDLVQNKAVSDIENKKIKITNIKINEKVLMFDIIGNKDTIINKTIEISLLNDFASNPGNTIFFNISDVEDLEVLDNGYNVKVDISDIYNNPYKIRMEIK